MNIAGVSREFFFLSYRSLACGKHKGFAVKDSGFLEREEDTDVETVYPLRKLQSLVLTPEGEDGDDEMNLTHNFENLANHMTNVTEDGKVKKKVQFCVLQNFCLVIDEHACINARPSRFTDAETTMVYPEMVIIHIMLVYIMQRI